MIKALLKKIRQKTLREIFEGILKRTFYIYPIIIISPLFNLLLLLTLVAISPVRRVKIGFLVTERIGHLGINTDLFLRRQQLIKEPNNITYIFIAGKPSNRQLLNMWKRHLRIIENQVVYDLCNHSKWLWKRTTYYNPLETFFNEYTEYQKTQPTLRFTSQEEEYGRNQLKKIGIDLEKNWYVCIYARDSGYLNTVYPKGNWEYHDYRNADIYKLKQASEYIAGIGGYVVRIGSHVERSFDIQNTRVIDYASKYRSDFMDIFMVAHCKFVVGNTSGICDLSMVFDVPYLGINCAPMGNVPHGKMGLFIPKKIKDQRTGRYVPFPKIIQETQKYNSSFWNGHWWHHKGYELIENTEEEILNAVKEMAKRVDGDFALTDEEIKLLEDYFRLYPANHWAQRIKTPIGIDFLKNHKELFFD